MEPLAGLVDQRRLEALALRMANVLLSLEEQPFEALGSRGRCPECDGGVRGPAGFRHESGCKLAALCDEIRRIDETRVKPAGRCLCDRPTRGVTSFHCVCGRVLRDR